MTQAQVLQLISTTGYAALFFGGLLGLLYSAFVLYDEGVSLLYFNDSMKDLGWLCLLLVPVDFCLIIPFIKIVAPYILL